MPITLSQAIGTGEELHVPADETELAVFSGLFSPVFAMLTKRKVIDLYFTQKVCLPSKPDERC